MKVDQQELSANLQAFGHKAGRYKVLIAVVLVLATYCFLVWRIESLKDVQPSPGAVTAQTNPLSASHIDKQVVSQLESLRDNSVNVRSLFDQARNNPFQ